MAEKPKPSKPITDAEQCLIWLDPVMAAAIDKARGVTTKKPKGKKTRPRLILELLATGLKLEGYEPRKPGRPKAQTPSE